MDTTRWGPVLRQYRKKQRKHMHQVGRELHISETCVARYERGERRIPPSLLVGWAVLLGAKEILTDACLFCPIKGAMDELKEEGK